MRRKERIPEFNLKRSKPSDETVPEEPLPRRRKESLPVIPLKKKSINLVDFQTEDLSKTTRSR
jgi:hypothetical protein